MAIESRIVNDSITELYVGGGNFLTQSAPTNFHTFHTQLQLTPGTSASDWREVTAAERAKIEAADAKWVRPPQSFIDEWNEHCRVDLPPDWLGYYGSYEQQVGGFNETTGFFELYDDIKDISYTEAQRLDSYWMGRKMPDPHGMFYQVKERTMLPLTFDQWTIQSSYGLFLSSPLLEVVALKIRISDMRNMFSNCRKLRKIYGYIYTAAQSASLTGGFNGCEALEEVAIFYLNQSISFSDSPRLSLKSIKFMVDNARNTAAITITLHPEAYARLTDELIAAAAEKQITFATI